MKTRNYLIAGIITVFSLMGTTVQAQETNYDESKVGTYVLPDALTMHNGQEVVNKEQWEAERRPEIIKLFQDNEYGILPEAIINSNCRIVATQTTALLRRVITL